ncbi:hypothetical protein [Brucella intermedia]|uniref:hypothetical protein n=1 Tax=Brucella intermedia TaxID=94625 RepID=UPI00124EEA73|nr:hypothetical protein [Brucella intermedia]KAB2708336.1 hypothetical protein F9K80_14685 [Brucella intermedia]
MAIFLARYSKNTQRNKLEVLAPDLLKYLPFAPRDQNHDAVGNSEMLTFYFDAALDRQIARNEDGSILFCHGYGDRNLEGRITASFMSRTPLDLVSFPEAFCAIRLSDEGMQFAGSGVGVDAIYYLETDSEIVATNRHNLLAPWAVGRSLQKSTFAWIVGRGHGGDFNTYWEGIKRTHQGSVYYIDGGHLKENSARFTNLFDPIETRDIPAHITQLADQFGSVLTNTTRDARLWLSGGKDSRAIAGLLSNHPRFRELTFSTHGEKFSPDIMAATKVAEMLGITDNYSTMRQGIAQPSVDIAASIANDLVSDAAGSSLADFRSIAKSDLLIFGGHENGFKTKPNTLELEAYLKSRRYWADSQGVLTKDAYANINGWYVSRLRELLVDAPVSRYPQVEALVFLIGTRLTGSQGNAHVSRSEVHPFLDGRMLRLLMGVSEEALDNQMIHYAMMRHSYAPLEVAAFAADKWPERTQELARSIGIPFRGEPIAPYDFKPYFPSQKVFGGYSWRLDLIERTKPFIWEYLNDNRDFFDFLDLKKVNTLAERPLGDLRISDIYYHLGLLKACLLHHFSDDDALFNFEKRSEVAERISQLFDASKTKATTQNEELDAYKKKLDDYETCIATMVENERNFVPPVVPSTVTVSPPTAIPSTNLALRVIRKVQRETKKLVRR